MNVRTFVDGVEHELGDMPILPEVGDAVNWEWPRDLFNGKTYTGAVAGRRFVQLGGEWVCILTFG